MGMGQQTVVFDISEQLKALRLLPDGRMLGAAIPFQGTAGGTPDPNTTVTPAPLALLSFVPRFSTITVPSLHLVQML